MEKVSYNKDWAEPLRVQEELLRTDALSSDDAFKLGGIMLRLAKDVYRQPVSIRVIVGGQTVFSHLMDGTSLHNEWWMDKKLNVSRISGMSSLRTCVELWEGRYEMQPEFENDGSFAVCGGCFPLRTKAGRLIGFVESSGMKHNRDHQLIADALADLLGVEIPTVAERG